MMAKHRLDRDDVLRRSRFVRSFPSTIARVLETVDDPDGTMKVLVECIEHDPLITARVLFAANSAAARVRRESGLSDIYTATAMIGMGRVREIALVSSIEGFMHAGAQSNAPHQLWRHSVAVGVCCQELALHITEPVCTSTALVAGLLHDIGQFWLYSFDAKTYLACWSEAGLSRRPIEVVEQEYFGVDHCTIGAWLAQDWALSDDISAAILGHHFPDAQAQSPLVPLLHIAEVLSNALGLSGDGENRVTRISSDACQRLGLIWNDTSRSLLGRIEARSRHANQFFSKPEQRQ